MLSRCAFHVIGLFLLFRSATGMSWHWSKPYYESMGRSDHSSNSACKSRGQFLRHTGDPCSYFVCDAGNLHLQHNKIKVELVPKKMPCAPGTSVPYDYEDYSMTNPCTKVDKDTCPGHAARGTKSSGYHYPGIFNMGSPDYGESSYKKLSTYDENPYKKMLDNSVMSKLQSGMAWYGAKTLRNIPKISQSQDIPNTSQSREIPDISQSSEIPEISQNPDFPKRTRSSSFYTIMLEKLDKIRRSLDRIEGTSFVEGRHDGIEGKSFVEGSHDENHLNSEQTTKYTAHDPDVDWREPIMEPIVGPARSRYQTATGYGLRSTLRMPQVKVVYVLPIKLTPVVGQTNSKQKTTTIYHRISGLEPVPAEAY